MLSAEKCAPRVFAPEKFALAFSVCRLNFVLLFLGSRRGVARKYKKFAPMEKNPAYCIYKKLRRIAGGQ